jgi:hypothetical protein
MPGEGERRGPDRGRVEVVFGDPQVVETEFLGTPGEPQRTREDLALVLARPAGCGQHEPEPDVIG